MKIAYFDCFAGASGDMILGALMDAGLELEQLKNELAKLNLTHYDIQLKKVVKRGIGGSQALVSVDEDHHRHHHRHLRHIEEIIEKSSLKQSVKEKSLKVFRRLAEVEAKVHQTTVEKIHFHEVGAMDSIIDVVGAIAGLEALEIDRIYCSPFHVGAGMIECDHGTFPVPAPATIELVRGKPIYSTGVEGELLTPTGAAILTTLSSDFGPMPSMTVETIGYGAGSSEPAIPNLLRVVIGTAREEIQGYEMDRMAVIETSIDDMNPQLYDYIIHQTLDMGAMDVFLTPIHMKKNRPATLITIICFPEMIETFADFLLRETTTIGLRWRVDNRIKGRRTIKEIQTKYGVIRVKMVEMGQEIINISPEYEDCKRVALENKIPLKNVMEEVRSTAYRTNLFHLIME